MSFDKKVADQINRVERIQKVLKKDKIELNRYLEPEGDGYLIAENENEKTLKISQEILAQSLPKYNKDNIFNLDLNYGSYNIDFSSNGNALLLGGEKGHISMIELREKNLVCELNVSEDKLGEIFAQRYNVRSGSAEASLHIRQAGDRAACVGLLTKAEVFGVSAASFYIGSSVEEQLYKVLGRVDGEDNSGDKDEERGDNFDGAESAERSDCDRALERVCEYVDAKLRFGAGGEDLDSSGGGEDGFCGPPRPLPHYHWKRLQNEGLGHEKHLHHGPRVLQPGPSHRHYLQSERPPRRLPRRHR